MWPDDSTKPELFVRAGSSLRIHQWAVALEICTEPRCDACCAKYDSWPWTCRSRLRSLSDRGFSHPSRARMTIFAGIRKNLVLRYLSVHLDGEAAPAGASIVFASGPWPCSTTMV